MKNENISCALIGTFVWWALYGINPRNIILSGFTMKHIGVILFIIGIVYVDCKFVRTYLNSKWSDVPVLLEVRYVLICIYNTPFHR